MYLLTSKMALFKLELSSCPSLLTRQLCTGGSEEDINVTALSLSFGRQIKILSPEEKIIKIKQSDYHIRYIKLCQNKLI